MATKNALCPYCQPSHTNKRVFPVNAEAAVAYCPYCMKQIAPKKAVDLYNKTLDTMIRKAEETLFVVCDPILAYRQYADVLEVEKTNSRALLGRILCLIYTSKVRHAYLVEANILLESIQHKGVDEVNTYVNFLKKINFALDEYNAALNKKLANHRNLFYDVDCLKLYLTHLTEIIRFKKSILNKLKEIRDDYLTQRNDKLLNLVNHDIEVKEGTLRGVQYLANGVGYKVTKIVGDKVYVDESGDRTDIKMKGSYYSLTPHKHKRLIKDLAFRDYTPLIHMKRVATFFIFLFLLVSIGFGVLGIIYMNNKTYLASCITGIIIFGFVALFLFLLRLVWSTFLKKRKLRID